MARDARWLACAVKTRWFAMREAPRGRIVRASYPRCSCVSVLRRSCAGRKPKLQRKSRQRGAESVESRAWAASVRLRPARGDGRRRACAIELQRAVAELLKRASAVRVCVPLVRKRMAARAGRKPSEELTKAELTPRGRCGKCSTCGTTTTTRARRRHQAGVGAMRCAPKSADVRGRPWTS